MTITATASCAPDVAWVEELVAASTKLQETHPEIYTLNGHLWVKAEGGGREAHAWQAAVGGSIRPSHIHNRVRRQQVWGTPGVRRGHRRPQEGGRVMKPVIPAGPIETEPHRDAAWLRSQQTVPYTDEVRAQRHREDVAIILDELAAAGVELGAYDRRTIAWLADWEYGTLVTIASWIKRSHASGKPGPRTRKRGA